MDKIRITNPKKLRKNNKSNIMWQLYNEGSLSRLQLAKKCHLTTPSITQLIQELKEENAVIEIGAVQRNATGRKEVLVDINYNKFLSISINIEADNTHIAVVGFREIKEDIVIKTNNLNLYNTIDNLAKQIEYLVSKYPTCTAICIGVVGIIDKENGIVKNSYGLFPNNYPLVKLLQDKKINIPIYIINNVIAQALSLKTKNNSDYLYIKHSPGVGCAIIASGKIVSGYENKTAELGHTIAEPNGKKCKCGKYGCLETLVSENALLEDFYKITNKKLEINELYNLYKVDNDATKILDFAIYKMAIAISNIDVVVNPQKIIVNGGLFLNNSLYRQFLVIIKKLGCSTTIQRIEKELRIKTVAEGRYILSKKIFEV